jgi:hypothetical protein
MSKSIIGDELWAEMTEAQKAEAVQQGRATLRQMIQAFLDGPESLRKVSRNFLSQLSSSFAELPIQSDSDEPPYGEKHEEELTSGPNQSQPTEKRVRRTRSNKQRFGLPEGFEPRLQRYGRSALLESQSKSSKRGRGA